MPKYLVQGTASWPPKHPSESTTEWEGMYESTSVEDAKKKGEEATRAAWPDAKVVATGAQLVGD